MKDPENITFFKIATACILADLYKAFPGKMNINCDDYRNALVQGERMPVSCSDLDCGNNDIIGATITFLSEEHYITFQSDFRENLPHSSFSGVRLSTKGFNVLDQPSQVIGETEKTLGSKFTDVAKKTISVGHSSVIRDAVSTIFS